MEQASLTDYLHSTNNYLAQQKLLFLSLSTTFFALRSKALESQIVISIPRENIKEQANPKLIHENHLISLLNDMRIQSSLSTLRGAVSSHSRSFFLSCETLEGRNQQKANSTFVFTYLGSSLVWCCDLVSFGRTFLLLKSFHLLSSMFPSLYQCMAYNLQFRLPYLVIDLITQLFGSWSRTPRTYWQRDL